MKYCPSCDTLAIPAEYSASGCSIFAKNSDREVSESQLLLRFPAEDFSEGATVRCTYISIEQVPHTYALTGSKPWWMWGLEMGINECGVAIGNEAEWSNIPTAEEDALLGMDLVRLGLERGATAKEALEVVIRLLERYGQGGACKYQGTRRDSSYHNSFIIADPNEIYLLETVGRHWVYRRLKDAEGISNVYSTGEDFDAASKDIELFAESKGLHDARRRFDFSKSFLLMNYHFLGGFTRAQWSTRMLRERRGKLNAENVLGILRGHYEGDTVENRWSAAAGCIPCVCMHGSEPTRTHSAATMVIEYHRTVYPELLYTYWGSMCPPCCSLIIPFYNTGYIPERLGRGKNVYEENSFWWKINRMVSDIESNYERYHDWLEEIRKSTEAGFRIEAQERWKQAEELLRKGRKSEACQILDTFTEACLDEAERIVEDLTGKIERDMEQVPGQVYRSGYLAAYRQRVKLPRRTGNQEEPR